MMRTGAKMERELFIVSILICKNNLRIAPTTAAWVKRTSLISSPVIFYTPFP